MRTIEFDKPLLDLGYGWPRTLSKLRRGILSRSGLLRSCLRRDIRELVQIVGQLERRVSHRESPNRHRPFFALCLVLASRPARSRELPVRRTYLFPSHLLDATSTSRYLGHRKQGRSGESRGTFADCDDFDSHVRSRPDFRFKLAKHRVGAKVTEQID